MKRDPVVFFDHILECIALIEEYVSGHSLQSFLESVPLQDQVLRRIEIIGEAAHNLPEELKQRHPEVPWQRMTAMRNFLIHNYFGVDLELAWRVATVEIGILKNSIQEIRREILEAPGNTL